MTPNGGLYGSHDYGYERALENKLKNLRKRMTEAALASPGEAWAEEWLTEWAEAKLARLRSHMEGRKWVFDSNAKKIQEMGGDPAPLEERRRRFNLVWEQLDRPPARGLTLYQWVEEMAPKVKKVMP